MSVRLPTDARDKLLALSRLRKQPQWRLIVDSVECYLRDLPPDERRQLEGMTGKRPRAPRAVRRKALPK